MIDPDLLDRMPAVYAWHKGTLTPDEIWIVQETLAQRFLQRWDAAHKPPPPPAPPEPHERVRWPKGGGHHRRGWRVTPCTCGSGD